MILCISNCRVYFLKSHAIINIIDIAQYAHVQQGVL